MRALLRVAAGLALLAPAPALAHSFRFTDVRLVLGADQRFEAELTCDLDALALGVEPGADSAGLAEEIEGMPAPAREALVAKLAETLKRRLRVRFSGAPVPFEVSFPERGKARPAGSPPSALGLLARLAGSVPPGAQDVSFSASRGFPPVRLEILAASGQRLHVQMLQRGAESTPASLAGVSAVSRRAILARFLKLGFGHILPEGLDHVLFVLGLALFGARLAPLLVQVTAFTVAHTLTLALSTYGVVRLSPRVVEPLIAFSIAYVAIENLFAPRLRFFRVLLVFLFGLLHGLGFAGALLALGLPEGERVLALLAFNGGVELGQLTVILPVFLALKALEKAGLERRHVVRPLSLGIAGIGLYWTVARLLAGPSRH